MKIYAVYATVKKGECSEWEIDVLANSIPEAKKIAKALWTFNAHPFHLTAKPTRLVKYAEWTKTAWLTGVWPNLRWVYREE